MSQYPLLYFIEWTAKHGQHKVHSSVCKPTHRHTPLPDIVYFSLSKQIGTPVNHISVAAECPSPPLEFGEMEQKKGERERERDGGGEGYSSSPNVPVSFSQIIIWCAMWIMAPFQIAWIAHNPLKCKTQTVHKPFFAHDCLFSFLHLHMSLCGHYTS